MTNVKRLLFALSACVRVCVRGVLKECLGGGGVVCMRVSLCMYVCE